MKRLKRLALMATVAANAIIFSLISCAPHTQTQSQPQLHVHTFDTKWSHNETHHWHAATCEHATEVSEKAAHDWGNAKNLVLNCTVCGMTKNTIDVTAENLTLKDCDTYTITNPVTIKNGDLKNGKLIIQSTDVVLEGLTNIDTIVVSEKIGDGNFTVKNCATVKNLYLNGGGDTNAIQIEGTKIEKLTSNKTNVGIALKKGNVSTASRAATNETTSEIEKLYALRNCQIESDSADNSLEYVAISKTTQSLALTGQTSVNKIISANTDADEAKAIASLTGAENFIIYVSADTRINKIDNIFSEENIKEATRSAGNSCGATSENMDDEKAALANDCDKEQDKAYAEMEADYTADLSGTFPSNYFVRGYGWDEYGAAAENYNVYKYTADITKSFSTLPKANETVHLTLNAKLSKHVDGLYYCIYEMDENYVWTTLVSALGVAGTDIDENGNFTLDAMVTFENTPKNHISLDIGYWKGALDDNVKLETGSTETEGNLYKIDVSDLLPGTSFVWWDGGASFGASIDISSKLPKKLNKNDIIQYTIKDAKLSADIKYLTTHFYANMEYNTGWLTGSIRDIKAETPFSRIIEERVGVDLNLDEEGSSIYLCFRYYKDDYNEAARFIIEGAETYDIDVTDLLPEHAFKLYEEGHYYFTQIDISSKFPSGKLLKKGDTVKFNFTGMTTSDIDLFAVTIKGSKTWLSASLPEIAKNTKAFTKFDASGECFIGDTLEEDEKIIMEIQYAESCNTYAVFVSETSKIIEPNLDNFFSNKRFDFDTPNQWYDTYHQKIDITSAFTGNLPNAGNIVKIKFDAKLTKNASNLKFRLFSDNNATLTNWEYYKLASKIQADETFNVETYIIPVANSENIVEIELAYDYDETDESGAIYGENYDPNSSYSRDTEDYKKLNIKMVYLDDDNTEKTDYDSFWDGKNVKTHLFTKDMKILALQAADENLGSFKIISIKIDDVDADFNVNWGCTLDNDIVTFTSKYGELTINPTNAKAGSTLVITLE